MRDLQIRLNLRDFCLRHHSLRVWYRRQRYQCTHLGPAVQGCYCDPKVRIRHP